MKTFFAVFALIAVGLAAEAEIGVQSGLPPFSEGLVPLTNGRSRAVRYYISTFTADAYTASVYCRDSGHQLASIETNNEQRELELYMDANQVTGAPWISGTDIKTEGTWLWGNGFPITNKNNFVAGQGESTINNCLMILGVDNPTKKFQWQQERCREQYTFICE